MKTTAIPHHAIPLFAGMTETERESLLRCLKSYTRDYRKGEFVLLDQEDMHRVGIVLSGSVHALKEDLWGHKTLLAYMDPGELFGETQALNREARAYVSYYAAANSRVLFLSLEHLLTPCKKNCPLHEKLSANLFRLIGERNLRLAEKVEVASKATLRGKILAYLSLEAQKQGQKYIKAPLNRTEMASFLQANRSAMTRELALMRQEGLIDYDGNIFVLKEPVAQATDEQSGER